MIGLSVEQQLKAFEENKFALEELQEEITTYRRERAENERFITLYVQLFLIKNLVKLLEDVVLFKLTENQKIFKRKKPDHNVASF